jgi:hypothetical protein
MLAALSNPSSSSSSRPERAAKSQQYVHIYQASVGQHHQHHEFWSHLAGGVGAVGTTDCISLITVNSCWQSMTAPDSYKSCYDSVAQPHFLNLSNTSATAAALIHPIMLLTPSCFFPA